MQIVIDIDDDMYKSVVNNDAYVLGDADWILLENAIANGTPLPEHHGRLIDVNDLLDDINLEDNDYNRDVNTGEIITLENIDRIPTIIEGSESE